MNAADILKLVNAGYTKADIEALTAAPEVKPAEAAPEVKPAEAAPEIKAPEAPDDKAQLDPEIAKTLALMNETLGKLQAFAVKTDGSAAKPETNDYKTILSSVYGKKE